MIVDRCGSKHFKYLLPVMGKQLINSNHNFNWDLSQFANSNQLLWNFTVTHHFYHCETWLFAVMNFIKPTLG